MTVSLIGTPGSPVYTDDNVPSSQALTPGTGTGYAVGDTILCFTASISKTASVATPSGWTRLGSGVGSSAFQIVLFGKVAASTTEAAPSLAWSGLTTGTNGSTCGAVCQAVRGLDTTDITTMVDVAGSPADGSASATLVAGGGAITTAHDQSMILKMAIRGGAEALTWSCSGYTNVTGGGSGASLNTTNGGDTAAQWAFKILSPAGLEAASNFTVTGGVSHSSLGLMIALKAALGPSNVDPPVLSGDRVVGATLTTTDGTWGGSPTIARQWQKDGVDISAQTATTYVPVSGDIGHTITCLISATSGAGTTRLSTNGLVIVAEFVDADLQYWTSTTGLGGAPNHHIPTPSSVFDPVGVSGADTGEVNYRLVYLVNSHAVRTVDASKVWIETQTTSPSTAIAMGLAPEAIGTNGATIADEFAAPASVTFSAPVDSTTGLVVGDLPPGQFKAIWLRWTVDPGADTLDPDTCTLGANGAPV